MANSVSNDALWEKLSEISEQIKSSKQAKSAPDFSDIKDEILADIERQTIKLGKHNDINYGAFEQNWKTTDEDVKKILNVVSRIRKQQRETAEQQVKSNTEKQSEVLKIQEKGNQEYLNFRFFKLRKTSIVIATLSLLILILTMFCMKQQNDYMLLNQEYYRKSIIIPKLHKELDIDKK